MVDPGKIAELDQAVSTTCEIMPPLWAGMMEGCVEKGLSRLEAIELIKHYTMIILTQKLG